MKRAPRTSLNTISRSFFVRLIIFSLIVRPFGFLEFLANQVVENDDVRQLLLSLSASPPSSLTDSAHILKTLTIPFISEINEVSTFPRLTHPFCVNVCLINSRYVIKILNLLNASSLFSLYFPISLALFLFLFSAAMRTAHLVFWVVGLLSIAAQKLSGLFIFHGIHGEWRRKNAHGTTVG